MQKLIHFIVALIALKYFFKSKAYIRVCTLGYLLFVLVIYVMTSYNIHARKNGEEILHCWNW